MKSLIIIISAGFLSCADSNSTSQSGKVPLTGISGRKTLLTPLELKKLARLNIDFQFRSNFYAFSGAKYTEASHGEAHSDNLPGKVDRSLPRQGFYLSINQTEFTKISPGSLGCKLYLVNTTDSLIKLNASDSRLPIIAEAINQRQEWVPISYLPTSWCGNSRHTITLDTGEYWSFNVPVFEGRIKTKLRYTLIVDKNLKINSNEIIVYLNKDQFNPDKGESYKNRNVMDPYSD